MEIKQGFTINLRSVVRNENISSSAKLLYAEIYSLCKIKNENICWASNAYFSKMLPFKSRYISKLISELVKEGLIYSQTSKLKVGYKRIIKIIPLAYQNEDDPNKPF